MSFQGFVVDGHDVWLSVSDRSVLFEKFDGSQHTMQYSFQTDMDAIAFDTAALEQRTVRDVRAVLNDQQREVLRW